MFTTYLPPLERIGSYSLMSIGLFFFFFQAEDGIRYSSVTGVQTCALPILDVNHVALACRAEARGGVRPPSPFGLRRGSLLSLRERRLVGDDGLEPPTPSV